MGREHEWERKEASARRLAAKREVVLFLSDLVCGWFPEQSRVQNFIFAGEQGRIIVDY